MKRFLRFKNDFLKEISYQSVNKDEVEVIRDSISLIF
jgi:hypothetical protein